MQAGHQTAVAEDGNYDCYGKVIYTEDIVIMKDGGQYDGWNGQVKSVGPGDCVVVSIGMPPGYMSESKKAYNRVRRGRRPGAEHTLSGRDCKVMTH